MTEHEALAKIQDLICAHWGTDPMYNSTNPEEAKVAKLCCKINEVIAKVMEKKLYAIFYEQFFFGDQYIKYVKIVETYDIHHDVGELIYHAATAVKNMLWCELSDKSIAEAKARYEKTGLWEPTVKSNILKRSETQ